MKYIYIVVALRISFDVSSNAFEYLHIRLYIQAGHMLPRK